MAFCGSKSDAMSVKDGVLQNECFVDVLNIIPHATLSLIGIFIVTVWNHSVMGKLKAKTWVHFQVSLTDWVLSTLTLPHASILDKCALSIFSCILLPRAKGVGVGDYPEVTHNL